MKDSVTCALDSECTGISSAFFAVTAIVPSINEPIYNWCDEDPLNSLSVSELSSASLGPDHAL